MMKFSRINSVGNAYLTHIEQGSSKQSEQLKSFLLNDFRKEQDIRSGILDELEKSLIPTLYKTFDFVVWKSNDNQISDAIEEFVFDRTLLSMSNNSDDFLDTLESSFDNVDLKNLIVVDVITKPGVTNNRSLSAIEMVRISRPNIEINRDEVSLGDCHVFCFNISLISELLKQDFNQVKSWLNKALQRYVRRFLSNPLVENIHCFTREDIHKQFSSAYLDSILTYSLVPEQSSSELLWEDIEHFNIESLLKLNDQRHLALSYDELKHIHTYYSNYGDSELRKSLNLPSFPSVVELEIVAQTWSEHCKHKIFSASIEYEEDIKYAHKVSESSNTTHIDSLYKSFVKQTTKDLTHSHDISSKWCLSVFKDNAGVVVFDDPHDSQLSWAIKVETHNSPSALDPYGGALTGILGVNRDILGCGLGFKPVANVDIFCLAPPFYSADEYNLLPEGPVTPDRMLDGVHKGVQDGGNHSGIPTIAGAFYFDSCFAGKPLVFCGTLGVAPRNLSYERTSEQKFINPGDKVVIIGGAVGRDGIHGATFSSRELDETSPLSAVQIGDPLIQKRVLDFTIEARDKNLFSGITDNGAGGLSSSVGEMAEIAGGAQIELSHCPQKYPGLMAYEIMISESQERMTLSVPPHKVAEVEELAKKHQVPCCTIGEFNSSGNLSVFFKGDCVALLDLKFLHESLPQMNLKARWSDHEVSSKESLYRSPALKVKSWEKDLISNLGDASNHQKIELTLKMLLKNLNVASKEKLIRKYDHEVQGATIGKPFYSKITDENESYQSGSSPRDGGCVWADVYSEGNNYGVLLALGLSPIMSNIDPYIMALYSVDECFRNLISQGADLDRVALLDNFCWPDPVLSEKNPNGDFRLGQLVRTCHGLRDICLTYNAPLVSGKDSMKNDFKGKSKQGENLNISVDPTLLVTGIAKTKKVNLPWNFFENNVKTNILIVGPEVNVRIEEFKPESFPLSLVGSTFSKEVGPHDCVSEIVCAYSTLFKESEKENDLLSNYTQSFLSKNWSELIENCYSNYKFLSSCLNSDSPNISIEAIHDISEGGAITSICEMSFLHKTGVHLNLEGIDCLKALELLFGEGPGCFIVCVSDEGLEKLSDYVSESSFIKIGETVPQSSQLEISFDKERVELNFGELYHFWNSFNSRLDSHQGVNL